MDWCQKRDVICEAYSPLVRGQRFGEPILQSMAKKYVKTPAQILLRWSLQKVADEASIVDRMPANKVIRVLFLYRSL